MSYRSSIKNWEGLAKRDALWSILTDDQKKGGKWNNKEFFESGKKEVEDIFSLLSDYKGQPKNLDAALDFGCGAGRLTRALGKRFNTATGVDASPTMLELAREANAEFKDLDFLLNQSDDLSQIDEGSYDLVLSLIVLQHIPMPHSLSFVSEFMRILKPGGVAIFQVPVEDHRSMSLFQRLRSFLKIRERLALLGIGKGFHMAMHCIPDIKIRKAAFQNNCEEIFAVNTNHTDPDFNGKMKLLGEGELASGFVSKLYAFRKS